MNAPARSFLFRVWPYLALTLARGRLRRPPAADERSPARRRRASAARAAACSWAAAGRGCWLGAARGGARSPACCSRARSSPGRRTPVAPVRAGGGSGSPSASPRSRRASAARGCTCARPARGGWSLAVRLRRFGVPVAAVHRRRVRVCSRPAFTAGARRGRRSRWRPTRRRWCTGGPAPAFVEHLPFLVRLHLFAAFAALAVFPASRLAVVPARAARTARCAPRGPRARRGRAARRRVAARRDRRAWLWPDAGGPLAGESRRRRRPAQAPGKTPAWWQRRGATAPRRQADGGKAVVMSVCARIVFGFVALGAGGGLLARGATRIGVHQGYAPEQPIAFPHKLHAGDNKIPCLYCHSARAHQPPRRHPVGQRVHELPRAAREADHRDREAQGGGAAAAARSPGPRSTTCPTSSTSTTASTSSRGVACQRCHGAVERWTASSRWRRSPWAGASAATATRRTSRPARSRAPPRTSAAARRRSPGLDCASCHY